MEKNKLIISGAIVVGVILVLFLVFRKQPTQTVQQTETIPTEVIIPTIDSAVQVSLTAATGKKEVKLTINEIPIGTQSIEYELSYQTKNKALQGIIGTITVNEEKRYEKKLTLGTCSSGTCVYHEVAGAIKLNLKFNGEYGERMYVKDFEI